MLDFHVLKKRKGTNADRNAPVSTEIRRFKPVAEFARKAAFVSLLSLYPCAAPMAANDTFHHAAAKSAQMRHAASMTDYEKASLKKLVGALSLFAVSFALAGATIYFITRKKEEAQNANAQAKK